MNNAFESALKARLLWMEVRYCEHILHFGSAANAAYKARQIAADLATKQAHLPIELARYGSSIPPMFNDVEELAEEYANHYDYAVRLLDDQREQEAEARAEALALAYAQECIDSENWAALSLPDPAELSRHLYTGKSITVAQHFIQYDKGYVWMDNPYGVEGGLGEEPTIELCRSFLETVATGGMYGPEP